jgi:hypothetical protein
VFLFCRQWRAASSRDRFSIVIAIKITNGPLDCSVYIFPPVILSPAGSGYDQESRTSQLVGFTRWSAARPVDGVRMSVDAAAVAASYAIIVKIRRDDKGSDLRSFGDRRPLRSPAAEIATAEISNRSLLHNPNLECVALHLEGRDERGDATDSSRSKRRDFL